MTGIDCVERIKPSTGIKALKYGFETPMLYKTKKAAR